jgi:NADPH2:quinone reductase
MLDETSARGVRAVVARFGKDLDDVLTSSIKFVPQEVPLDQLGLNDVLVAVRATEIVWTDTVMATGQYQHQPKVPYAPGMTYSGVVVAAGQAVLQHGNVRLGDRIAVASSNAGPRSSGRYQPYGGCASYAIAPVSAIRRVPPSWNDDQAASFAYGYDTAYHALVMCGAVAPGQTILIHGASGGVGLPAVHLARALGLRVYCTTRSTAKAEALRALGVENVFLVADSTGAPRSFFKEVQAACGIARGVDIVYDGVGGDQLAIESIRSLRFGGKLLIVGWASTPNVAAGGGDRTKPARPNVVPTNLLMMKGIHAIGCPAMIATRFDKALEPKRSAALEKLLLSGALPPPLVAKSLPLLDLGEALRIKAASGTTMGAVIVRPPRLHSANFSMALVSKL